MKPTLCSRCKKNVAVVFITRLDNNGQGSHNEGLCLKCARELNIRPVTDMIEKMGLSDEELEGLTNEMMSAFEGAESMEGLLGNLSGALSDAANGNDDDEEDGRTATFPFLNKLMGNLAPTEGNDAKEESIPDVSPQAADGGRASRGQSRPEKPWKTEVSGKPLHLPYSKGRRRQAGPDDRPGAGIGAGDSNSQPPAEEQPLPHRGTRRGQNRHCRRAGHEDLPGRCAL